MTEIEEGTYIIRFVYINKQGETCVDGDYVYLENKEDEKDYIKKETDYIQSRGGRVIRHTIKVAK